MIESTYLTELNRARMIILMEQAPLSNQYLQVALTKEEYKKVTNFIWDLFSNKKSFDLSGNEFHSIPLINTDPVTLDSEIKDCYMDSS